jgi:hypothetical protein
MGQFLQVYGFDFEQSLNQNDNKEYDTKSTVLSEQEQYYAKYIKITLRHPMTSLLDFSNFYQQIHKPINYTFQFISCMGSQKIDDEFLSVITDIQKESSIQMLSLFF